MYLGFFCGREGLIHKVRTFSATLHSLKGLFKVRLRFTVRQLSVRVRVRSCDSHVMRNT